MLVIATRYLLEPGKVVNVGHVNINMTGKYGRHSGDDIHDGEIREAVFRVVREATQEEWLAAIEEMTGRPATAFEKAEATRRGYRYYEIQTD